MKFLKLGLTLAVLAEVAFAKTTTTTKESTETLTVCTHCDKSSETGTDLDASISISAEGSVLIKHSGSDKSDKKHKLESPLDIIPEGANVNYQEWNLTETIVSPDGHYRRGFLINGQSPGPLIKGNQDDWVVIKVNNYLTVPTTIHFHGIHQNGTIFSDGVPGVTQYPILSGDSYLYVWKMDQYGFYWYHAHFRGYANDGLTGPIYIYPSEEIERPYKEITSDEDEIKLLTELEKKPNYLLLSDWFKEPYDDIAGKMFAYGMDPTCVQTMLVNGKGRHLCFDNQTYVNEAANKYEKFMTIAESDTWSVDAYGCLDLQVINGFTSIKYDKSLLEFPGYNTDCFNSTVDEEVYYTNDKKYVFFNVINLGGEFSKTLNIDDHKITVVAIDGSYIKPQTAEQIYLPIGMRLSIVVETNEDDHENVEEPFAIRVQGDDMPQAYTALSYLQYGSYSNETYEHIQNDITYSDVNGVKYANLGGNLLNDSWTKHDPFKTSPYDTSLKPPTGPADVTIGAELLRLGQTSFSIFNSELFDGGMELDFPIAFKLAENSSINATEAFGGSVVDAGIKEGDVVDIIFQNTVLADHPMHLHGHTFWVLSKNDTVATFGYNSTQEALDDGKSDIFNFDDPPYVDNISVMTGGFAVIRFIAGNSIAMIHCHIQTHLTAGMGGVIVEDKSHIDEIPEDILDSNHADFDSKTEWTPSELNVTIV